MAGEVLSDETVYEGARFSVARVELAGRGGEPVRREVVRPSDAVVILPILEADASRDGSDGDATVVMIRNRRWAIGEVLWELPAGTLEPGEDAAECAERELAEETGYRVAAGGRIERLAAFYPSPGFCTEQLTLFEAVGLERGEQSLDPTEEIEAHPMPVGEALRMVRAGEIRDAKTIAGLLWWSTGWTHGAS